MEEAAEAAGHGAASVWMGQRLDYDAIGLAALNGTENPADLALIGDEDTVAAGLRAYAEAGATEIVLTAHHDLDAATRSRTRRLAGTLAREAGSRP